MKHSRKRSDEEVAIKRWENEGGEIPMTAQGQSTTGVTMQEAGAQNVIDYTTVPVGLRIGGHLWTGQQTSITADCPKCGRIGVASSEQRHQRVIVHSGRVDGNTLIGIDYCNLGFEATHGNGKEAYEEASIKGKRTHDSVAFTDDRRTL